MHRIPHTAAPRGKRVRVMLRNGTELIDKFIDRTDRHIILENHGKVEKSQIRSFSIYKPPSRGNGEDEQQ